jgi:thiol:disulfide interchange protein DsbG
MIQPITRRHTALLCASLVTLLATPGILRAADLPAPIKALQAKGVEVVGTFAAPAGLLGYAGIVQNRPLAMYVTADRKQVIIGTMLGANGEDLSQASLDKLVSAPMTKKTWTQLDASNWIGDGAKNAPRIVYTFTDPNCPYCNKFWTDARPWVKSGKVQLRHVMVGILRPDSAGKAAALLSAKDPQRALLQHEQQHANGGVAAVAPIAPKVRAQLDANENLMHELGFSATPTVLYKDGAGHLQTMQGAPAKDKLIEILGPL